MISASADQNKKPEIQIKCNVDGCKKRSKNINGLEADKAVKSSSNQTITNKKTSSTTKSEDKAKEDVPCDFNGFNQILNTENQPQEHQFGEHIITQSVRKEEPTAATMFEPKQAAGRSERLKMICDYEGCKLSFSKVKSLQKHRIKMHLIPLRCLFNAACMNSNVKYSDIENLKSHIASEHGASFCQQTCRFNECQGRVHVSDWSVLLNHMIEEHTNDLLR